MGRKDGIGNDRFFLPYNTSLLQTFRKKKYKSEINLHGDAFSVFLFPERKKSDRNRNRRKVSKNSRIVVFRIGAVWNNKNIQGKREVLRDDYKTRGDFGNERKLSVCQCGALPEAVGARLCGEGILYVWNGKCLRDSRRARRRPCAHCGCAVYKPHHCPRTAGHCKMQRKRCSGDHQSNEFYGD